MFGWKWKTPTVSKWAFGTDHPQYMQSSQISPPYGFEHGLKEPRGRSRTSASGCLTESQKQRDLICSKTDLNSIWRLNYWSQQRWLAGQTSQRQTARPCGPAFKLTRYSSGRPHSFSLLTFSTCIAIVPSKQSTPTWPRALGKLRLCHIR